MRTISNTLTHIAIRYSFYCLQGFREVHTISESKTSFGYILCSDLSCKIVQSSKKVSVYLLQTLDTTRLCRVQRSTLKKLVGFLLALSINSVITIEEPVKKVCSLVIIDMLCQKGYTLCIKRICQSLFPILELVTSTG